MVLKEYFPISLFYRKNCARPRALDFPELWEVSAAGKALQKMSFLSSHKAFE